MKASDLKKPILTFEGFPGDVRLLEFSPDGNILASINDIEPLKLWDVEKRSELQPLGEEICSCVAFSASGSIITVGMNNGEIQQFDINTHKLLFSYKSHDSAVKSLHVSEDNKTIFSSETDGRFCQKKLDNGQTICFEEHNFVDLFSYTKDYKAIKCVVSNFIKVLDAKSGELLNDFSIPDTGTPSPYAISQSGEKIIFIDYNNKRNFSLWDIETRQCIQTFTTKQEITGIAISPDEKTIVSVEERGYYDDYGEMKLWDAYAGNMKKNLGKVKAARYYKNHITYNPDGKTILYGEESELKLCDSSTGELVQYLHGHDDNVSCVAFSPNGQLIISGSYDKTLKLWNANGCLNTFSGHTDQVNTVVFSPDGKMILSGSNDKTMKLWDVSTGQCIQTFTGHGDRIYKIAFNQDGTTALCNGTFLQLVDIKSNKGIKFFWKPNKVDIISISQKTNRGLCVRNVDGSFAPGQCYLFDTNSLELQNYIIHQKAINAAAINPNGDNFAITQEKSIELYSTHDMKKLREFVGHTGNKYAEVQAIVFSADGRFIISGADDKTIRIWDVNTGETVRILKGHTDAIKAITVSRDGRYIASASDDTTLKLWYGVEVREINNQKIVSSKATEGMVSVSKEEWDELISCLNNHKKRIEKLESMVEKLFRSQENTKEDSETKNAVVERDSFEDF